MARVQINTALSQLSGKIDSLVFKSFKNGGSCIARMPKARPYVPTERQSAGNDRWRLATAYAKAVWRDPERRAFYQKLAKKRKAWRAFNLATGDFMNAPKIDKVDFSHYRGQPGGWFTIYADDDVGVVAVRATIRDTSGRVWESGGAGADPNGQWRYTTTAKIPAGTELEIEFAAEDRPGNCTMQWPKFKVPPS